MANSSEPCDDGDEAVRESSPLESFFKAAMKVAKVEHESEYDNIQSPSVCDLKDISANQHSTGTRLKLIKDSPETSSSTVFSFKKKENTKRITEKNKKG